MADDRAIACPHALSTQAGVDAYAKGGNAIDAALAAAASLTVTLPDNVTIGGDLIALLRDPDGTITVVNASGPAPMAIPVDDLRAARPTMPVRGPHTVTVPGVVAGWDVLHDEGANLPWRDVFDHAVTQARDGVPLARSVARALALEPDVLGADPGMRALFYPDRTPLPEGARLKQPALARTLETIAQGGARAFYEGETGASFVANLATLGGTMTVADLTSFEPELADPISTTRGHTQIFTAPPNSQGRMLLMILDEIGAADPLNATDAPAIAAAYTRATSARANELGDPRGDTVAVVAADWEGRAVSLIQSVFFSFGAGILDPATGIVAHNRGAFFSLDPNSPNVLAAGKRPVHTLTPALVEQGGDLAAVLGTMGGRAQPQILAQLIHRLGSGAANALAAPRWILEDGAVLAEDGVPQETLDALAENGWPATRLGDRGPATGQAHIVRRVDELHYEAAADPRSQGASHP
jgi:gamma-glutamyltranspeptidase